jgi:hypothetical protein
MGEDFYNTLAWFKAAPGNLVKGAQDNLEAAAQWIWEVLQGDFNDNPTTAQTVTGTVISMIPFVDQVCDVRDVVANCKKINEDSSNKWAWVGLVLTLIGLFPTLGSLAKGCFKILFAYGRKAVFSTSKAALDKGMWQATAKFVEAGIQKLNDFLARPEVRKTLKALKWDNPYKELAKLARELSGKLNVSAVTQQFDKVIDALKQLLDLVNKWGSAAMKTQAGQLLQTVKRVRDQANAKLGEVVKPVQDWLNKLARRLDVEADMAKRASVNTLNPHWATRLSLNAEVEALRKAPPHYVKVGKRGPHKALDEAPDVPAGHFDVGDRAARPLTSAYNTFAKDMHHDFLPPGTVLYRIVDPKSYDNSICWMTKAEFDTLKSKTDWRDRFAVWKNWNSNGEFITYTVPAGPNLPVWRGKTASQQLEDNGVLVKANDKGDGFWLNGGAEQIVVNPANLSPGNVSKRQPTGWGYSDPGDIEVSLVGVPVLTNNWVK